MTNRGVIHKRGMCSFNRALDIYVVLTIYFAIYNTDPIVFAVKPPKM